MVVRQFLVVWNFPILLSIIFHFLINIGTKDIVRPKNVSFPLDNTTFEQIICWRLGGQFLSNLWTSSIRTYDQIEWTLIQDLFNIFASIFIKLQLDIGKFLALDQPHQNIFQLPYRNICAVSPDSAAALVL